MYDFLKSIAYFFVSNAKRSYRDFLEYQAKERAYIVGQCLWLISLVISITLLPVAIKAISGNTANVGIVRATYLWTTALFSLSFAEILRVLSIRHVLIVTTLLRAVSFGVMGLLLIFNQLTLPLIIAIMIINGVIVALSHLLDLDTSGANQVFGDAVKKERALYIFTFIDYLSLMLIPLMLGIFIVSIERYENTSLALGLAYLSIAILMSLGAYLYYKHVYLENSLRAQQSLSYYLQAFIKSWISVPKRLWHTGKIIYHNGALLFRFWMISVEKFIDDALFMVILPIYALDVLNAGAFGNSLLISAMFLGGFISSMFMLTQAQKIQKRFGLYPFIVCLGISAACAFMPSIILWETSSLWLAALMVVIIKMLYEPIRTRLDSMLQIEIAMSDQTKAQEYNIYSLLSVVLGFSGGLGALFFAWVFQNSGPSTHLYTYLGENAAMKMVTLFLILFALIVLFSVHRFKRYVFHVYPTAKEDVQTYFQELETNLHLLGLPPLRKEVIYSPIPPNRPSIALLGIPSLNKLALLQEGGVQFPGNIHLVFDTSWIVQKLQPDGTNQLYLKKGLYFDEAGEATLVEYKNMRPIHYFANFATPGAGTTLNGIPLESKLNTPMSSSGKLEILVKDILLTRLWLSEKGITCIKTLAFLMPGHLKIGEIDNINKSQNEISLAAFPLVEKNQINILKSLEAFWQNYTGDTIVVKPSGIRFTAPYGVKFFARNELQATVAHILSLAHDPLMDNTGAILLEEKVCPPPLYLRIGENDGYGRFCLTDKHDYLHILTLEEIKNATPQEKKDWVLHIAVARTPWNRGSSAGIVARIDISGRPLTKQAAAVPFEDIIAALRQQYGLLKTPEEALHFENQLEAICNQALQAILEKEQAYALSAEDPLQSATDYLGIDFMIERAQETLIPKIIAITDHNVGIQHLFDSIYPDRKGEHSQVWIGTMLSRARQEIYKGKRLLLVGSGYASKRFFFEGAKALNLNIVLVDTSDSWAKHLVSEFIPVKGKATAENLSEAYQAVRQSIRTHGEIYGITTFFEPDVVFTAELARALGLNYHSVDAIRKSRQKAKTRLALKMAHLPTPQFFYIYDQHSLDLAIARITYLEHTKEVPLFPMVLKPNIGQASMYTTIVHNPQELQERFNFLIKAIEAEDKAWQFDKRFVLEEYIKGGEWDVDLVFQGGQAKYASITDNWSPNKLAFSADYDSLPSHRLSPEAQRASISLAIQAVTALGLSDGIIHAEGKYDPIKGAQILEINARPAGAYLTRWQKEVWGVDMVEMLYATALGIPLKILKSDVPLSYIEGVVYLPEKNGIFMGFEGIELASQSPGFKEFTPMANIGDYVSGESEKSSYLGILEVTGKNSDDALQNFMRIYTMIHPIIQPKVKS